MLKKLILLLWLTLWTPIPSIAEDRATPEPEVIQTTPMPTAISPTPSVSIEEIVSPTESKTPSVSISSKIFTNHLNSIDHAEFWTKFDVSYDFATQGDLMNSVIPINNQTYVNPGGLGSYRGSASFSQNGLGLGFEVGLLINPYSAIAFGAHFLQTDEYNAGLIYNNANQDSESVTLLPTVVPLSLDYYFVLPDSGGRFFFSAGVGYYIGNVRVGQKTTTDNFFGSNNTPGQQGGDIWEGNVSAAAVGFQAGLGREFALNDHLGLVLFATGRYARISNFSGQLLDSNAVAGNFGLATGANGLVDIDSNSNITGAHNEHYTVIDFTGFNLGIGLNFYSF